MDIQVTSAIIGGIDEAKRFPHQSLDHNYSVYITSPVDGTDRIKALYYKTQPHRVSEADIYIWIDGKIQVLCYDFIQQCIDALQNNDLAIMKHLYRKCIYEEVDHIIHCISKGNEYLAARYEPNRIKSQVEFYRKRGYPKNNGLNDCCIIICRNTQTINQLFDEWWDACEHGLFDQIAIQYLAWKYKVKIQPIVFKPGSFIDVPHKVLK